MQVEKGYLDLQGKKKGGKKEKKKKRKMHEKTYFEEPSVRERVTKRNRNMRLHT